MLLLLLFNNNYNNNNYYLIIIYYSSYRTLQNDVGHLKKVTNKSSKYMILIGHNLDTDIQQPRILINAWNKYEVQIVTM